MLKNEENNGMEEIGLVTPTHFFPLGLIVIIPCYIETTPDDMSQ